MDRTILRTLFLDNLEIPAAIARFCDAVPGYAQAEREYDRAAQELMELIGYERYARFEEALTLHMSFEHRAYYLFGLGLRREVLKGLAG